MSEEQTEKKEQESKCDACNVPGTPYEDRVKALGKMPKDVAEAITTDYIDKGQMVPESILAIARKL